MKWFANLISKIRRWFQPSYLPINCEDMPNDIERHRVYLIGEDGEAWQAALICPCGCDALIQLSLISQDDPCWSVKIEKKQTVSIMPSIWRNKGCRSHFFVNRGKILWVKSLESH